MGQQESGKRVAVIQLLCASFLWSLGGLLIKSIPLPPLLIAGGRSAVAFMVILVGVRRPRLTWSAVQLGGALAYAATVILFVMANKLTTAANAVVLQYTAPIHVALAGRWFLKEKTTPLDWITIGIVLSGIAAFFGTNLSAEGLAGNILALASGLSFAWLTLLMRKQKDGSPLESVLLGNALTALVGLPQLLSTDFPDASGIVGLLTLGILQLGIPYILYSKVIKRLQALDAALLSMIEPILNPLWVLLAMGESPGFWGILGGTLVLGGLTLRAILGSRAGGSKGG